MEKIIHMELTNKDCKKPEDCSYCFYCSSCSHCSFLADLKKTEHMLSCPSKEPPDLQKEIHDTPKTFRIEIGTGAYKNGKNDYMGKVGYVYFCNKCCNDWRIQFFSMGNSELLRNFDLENCKIFFADQI